MDERRTTGAIILDRRRASRIPVRCDVRCVHGGASFSATARNLNRYGVFVETEERVEEQAPVEISLYLPDGEAAPAKVMAQVARLARRRDEAPGFGANFESVDDATVARIEAAVKTESARANGQG